MLYVHVHIHSSTVYGYDEQTHLKIFARHQASLDLYSRILNVIERNEYDNFRKRAFTTKLEKAAILPGAWLAANSMKQ